MAIAEFELGQSVPVGIHVKDLANAPTNYDTVAARVIDPTGTGYDVTLNEESTGYYLGWIVGTVPRIWNVRITGVKAGKTYVTRSQFKIRSGSPFP